jgi:hypothetical protein
LLLHLLLLLLQTNGLPATACCCKHAWAYKSSSNAGMKDKVYYQKHLSAQLLHTHVECSITYGVQANVLWLSPTCCQAWHHIDSLYSLLHNGFATHMTLVCGRLKSVARCGHSTNPASTNNIRQSKQVA